MEYIGAVYRPPSEARSLIVQVTVGCAHNACTFCTMYKDKQFYIRSMADIKADFDEAAPYGAYIEKIFLADGDALTVPTEMLLEILDYIHQVLPGKKQITAYGTAQDILEKTPEELAALYAAGLDMIYMGVESGDQAVLDAVHKNVTAEEMVAAAHKLKNSGMRLSVTLISGLGGQEALESHAIASAEIISAIKPDYVGFLTLMRHPKATINRRIESGELHLLTPADVIEEMRLFLSHVDSEGTIFRANHASNYVILKGTLNADVPMMLQQLDAAQAGGRYRSEMSRRL